MLRDPCVACVFAKRLKRRQLVIGQRLTTPAVFCWPRVLSKDRLRSFTALQVYCSEYAADLRRSALFKGRRAW